MTIKEAILPKSSLGNDPNDFRAVDNYMRKIVPVPTCRSTTATRFDTEDDIALRFSAKHENKLRYVAELGKWLQWDEKVWKFDVDLAVFDMVRNLCRDLVRDDDSLRKRLLNAGAITAIERLAKSDRRHSRKVDVWDSNDWILNTPTGMVDLKTGHITPNDPNQHCTKITGVGPEGDCPNWKKFLLDVTGQAEELVSYIQRVMGYACTGSTKEHALFFFYGTGGNGKGTLLNAITDILNDYAVIANADVFTESKHERHPTELASLMGARLVVAQETDEGRKWDEAKIKALTGGDPVTARFMRQDFFTFIPKFTLIIAGNHKPTIQTVDEAMRRRLHLVPFNVTIPSDKRDLNLSDKLKAEAPGILRWIIEGVVAYNQQGLNPPQTVLKATDEYFEDEDSIQQWITDSCETGQEYWETPTILFNSWKQYATAANLPSGSNKGFKSKLVSAGYQYARASKGIRRYQGIKVKSQFDPNPDESF
jgi:putative DNA primase/helicase